MGESARVRRAAIDVGTVSTRLLVADVSDGRVTPVVRQTTVTHLGDGVAASGRISAASLDRTLDVVRTYRDLARDAAADDITIVATSAARDAENGPDFLERVRALDLDPQIVSGPREAYLSFRGATYSLRDHDVLVADLGGGSTELVFGSVDEQGGVLDVDVEASRSFDVGSRRVTDLFLADDPPTEAQLGEATSWVVEEVRPFFDGLRCRPQSMVALAGTATTLSAVRQGLDDYDSAAVHDSVLTGADLADLREELAGLPLADRRAVRGLEPERAEVIVGGVLVLEALLGLAGLDATIVSEHDILYGIVLTDD